MESRIVYIENAKRREKENKRVEERKDTDAEEWKGAENKKQEEDYNN